MTMQKEFEKTTPSASSPSNRAQATPPAQNFDVSSVEFAALIDERNLRMKRRQRRSTLITLLVLLAGVGGGYGWFISSPERVTAIKQAYGDVQSLGDIKGILARYQAALDKIAARGEKIDGATQAMGIDPSKSDPGKDPGFDTEMRAMMGSDGGPTSGERNAKLRERIESLK